MTPRDAEEKRLAGGTITPSSRDQEIRRITGASITWTGRDAEEVRKGTAGH